MTFEIETYLGKVILDSPAITADTTNWGSFDWKKRQQISDSIFPLDEDGINSIVLNPKEEKFNTVKHKDACLRYLKNEGILKDDGNFFVDVVLDLSLSPSGSPEPTFA